MTWFEELTGFEERSPDEVRQDLFVEGDRLVSRLNGRSWQFGQLETPTLAQLRDQARQVHHGSQPTTVREVVANVQHLHTDPTNEHALFQVASQFNLLEMSSPGVTPEAGVGIYEDDHTQGPACAIAAGVGTIYRNYFVEHAGQVGQSASHQINCLSLVSDRLNNVDDRLWQMVNGYALPSHSGLQEIQQLIEAMDEPTRDQLRQALKIGLQWNTQVTIESQTHTVSQAYCSAMPVAYTRHSPSLWKPFDSLILEAAYEATICAAIINADRTGCNRLFLTLLGGGVFGNNPAWIFNAIRRSLEHYPNTGVDVVIVSYGASNAGVRKLVSEFV